MRGTGIAVDNDVVFKAACYHLTSVFWPRDGASVGVLGAAQYVISSLLDEANLSGNVDNARADFAAFVAAATVLEPEPGEVALAAELELAAQRIGASLDIGESQLAAMAAIRSIERMQTGDKRAIGAFELVLDDVPSIGALQGRMVCLEQLVASVVDASFERIADAVCAEPRMDKALTFCFACHSPGPAELPSVRQGLASYIEDLRAGAPRMLAS